MAHTHTDAARIYHAHGKPGQASLLYQRASMLDPNNIAIEFSAPVEGVDIRKHPKMKDKKPLPAALEGADPQPGHWPEITNPTTKDERRVYPGEGMILLDDE